MFLSSLSNSTPSPHVVRIGALLMGLTAANFLVCAQAQTSVTGTITEDQTWDLAGSPYEVHSLTVSAGATLSVEPGVTVRIDDFLSLTIHGTIRSLGDSGQKITFTSASGAASGNPWGTLLLTNNGGNGGEAPSRFEHTVLEGGGHWFQCMVEASGGADVQFANCDFRTGPQGGLRYQENSGGDITDCVFDGLGGYGVWLRGSSPTLTRASFQDCGNAMRLESTTNGGGSYPVISSCTFDGDDRIHLVGDIFTSGTLMEAPYYLDGSTGVVRAEVELTIEAGTTFHAADWSTWTIHGNVTANGTAAKPILFSSASGATEGNPWGAVRLTNGETEGEGRPNSFSYCTFEGGGHWFNTLIEAYGGAPLTLDHCTFQHSRVHGLRLRGVSPDIIQCTFRDSNAGDAIRLESNVDGGSSYPRFEDTVFEGSERVHLIGDIHSSGTLTPAPYYVTGSTGAVLADVELQIDPGASFAFADWDSWTIHGNVQALGTTGAPIRFNSATGQNPWGALRLIAESARASQFDHCIFEEGGHWFDSLVDLDRRSNATFNDCEFRQSIAYGLRLRSASPALNRCLFADNGNAIRLDSSPDHGASYPVIRETVFEDDDRVHPRGDMHSSGTLSKAPYLLDGGTGVVSGLADVTIEPGSTFRLADFYSWTVHGSLIAEASEDQPITFTSLSGATEGNPWGAIRLTNDNGAGPGRTSRFDYCLFEGGGHWFDTLLAVSGGAPVQIQRSTFRHSRADGVRYAEGSGGPVSQTEFSDNGGYGLWLQGSSPSIEGCTFQNNAAAAVALLSTADAGGSFPVYAGNTYGPTDRIEIASHIHSNGTLHNPGSPYFVRNSKDILTSSNVQIEPGTTMQFGDFAGLVVRGSLVAQGSAVAPVLFTSDDAEKAPGQWAALVFTGERTQPSRLRHCQIEGGGHWFGALVEVSGSAEVSLEASRLRLCSGDGVQLLADSQANLTSCSISSCNWSGISAANSAGRVEACDIFENTSHGIYTSNASLTVTNSLLRDNLQSGLHADGSATPGIIDSVISGNGSHGVRNTGSNILTAPNNWWGDPTGPFHAILNPEGLGDQVSNNVDFQPFRTVVKDIPQVVTASLENGVPYSGAFTRDANGAYFAVEVAAGQHLTLTFDDLDDLGITQVYLSRGRFPTSVDYDERHEMNGADQQLFIPQAGPGTWYVLVHQFGAAESSAYTLRADIGDIALSSVTPARHANTVPIVLTLEGAGFGPGASVDLLASGVAHSAATTEVDSGTQITATFAANTIPAGPRYAVRVSIPGKTPALLPDAFEAVAGGRPRLVTNLIVPGQVGYHQLATLYVEYSNAGEVAMPAPILIVTAFQGEAQRALLTLERRRLTSGFWTSAVPDGFSNVVQFLASGDVPGVLQPGESKRVPVYYAGWQKPWDFAYPPIEFRLATLSSNDARPIDWADLRSSLLPNQLPADAFDILFDNYRQSIGNTLGDLVTTLSENAAYLGRLGHDIRDVDELNLFEFKQADGFTPLPFLSDVLDVEMTGAGFPLFFQRVYPVALSQRLRVGDLGRGWRHNWSFQLRELEDGTVEIRFPNGIRRFQPDSRGGYFSSPGDLGVLTGGSGSYTLTEPTRIRFGFSSGRIAYLEDRNGARITAVYQGDRLIRLDHSRGASLSLERNAQGRITALADDADRRTTFQYDGAGNLVKVTRPNGAAMNLGYFGAHEGTRAHALRSIAEDNGRQQSFAYDARGRLAETSLAGGAEQTTYAYDSVGGVAVTNALGQATGLRFDHHGEPARMTNPVGANVLLRRNSLGRLAEMIDSYGYSTRYRYDAEGRLESIANPIGATRRFKYDQAGNAVRLTDPMGFSKQFQYDANGNLLQVVLPDGTTREASYGAAGEVTAYTNGRGQEIQYTYDPRGNVTRKSYPDGSQVDYEYDATDRLTKVTDPAGESILTYDSQDRLTRIAFPDGRFKEYTYDPYDRRTSIRDQDGATVTYHYDDAGRLSELRDGDGQALVTYTFDAAGNVTRESFGDGRVNTYTYNEVGLISQETRSEAQAGPADKGVATTTIETDYDLNGRSVAVSNSDGFWTMDYDPAGRLTDATLVPTPGADPQTFEYTYDLRDRYQSTATDGTITPFIANENGQYTQAGDTAYTYDHDGNMTSRTSVDTGTISYNYDPENRLSSASSPTTNWTANYNGLGHMSSFAENGNTTVLSHDVLAPTTLSHEYNAGGDLLSWHLQGLRHHILSRTGGSFLAPAPKPKVEPPVLQAAQHNSYSVNENGVPIIPTRRTEMRAAPHRPTAGEVLSSPAANQFSNWLGIAADTSVLASMKLQRFASFPSKFKVRPKLVINVAGNVGRVAVTYGTAAFTVAGGSYEMYQGYKQGGPEGTNKIFHGAGWTTIGVGAIAVAAGATVLATPVLIAGVLATVIDLGFELENQYHLWRVAQIAEGGPYVARPGIPIDPNQKVGPIGVGDAHYVAAAGLLPYRVDFENDEDARAPAQVVFITDPLSDQLDWTTFELTEAGFGDTVISIPSGTQRFESVQNIVYLGRYLEVSVTISLNPGTGLITAIFSTLDPETGLPPEVTHGFLPPEDGTGRGQGHFSYVIRANEGLPTGTEIRNIATIVFDFGESIDTNQIDPHDPSQGTDPEKEAPVTIDATPPTSAVQSLPASSGPDFTVNWSGDDGDASGIGSYTIYVKDDDGDFEPWLAQTAATSATFNGLNEHTYQFYSIATDGVGNREPAKSAAEATTTVSGGVDPYDSWLVNFFTAQEIQSGVITARDADPDGDGRNNFDEYSFVTNPRVYDQPTFSAGRDGPRFFIIWNRRKTGVLYQVQESINLENWSDAIAVQHEVLESGVDFERVRSSVPIGGHLLKFLRVMATP